jgi:HSP20 family protein
MPAFSARDELARRLRHPPASIVGLPKSDESLEERFTTVFLELKGAIAMVGTLKPRWSVVFPKPFESVTREMDHLFDNFLGGQSGREGWFAPASLWEEEGRWCLEVDLPGVKQEDVDVTLEKSSLRITAERKEPADRNYFHQERAFGRIDRLITLPETVDPDGIQAELKDGVLHLALTKRPESQPKKISVKTN